MSRSKSKLGHFLALLGALMGSLAMGLSFSVINTNLESLNQYLGASIVQLQWMINIYGIFISSALVTMGRLGDIFGRKKIYLIGTALFGIAMLGAGLAPNPAVIIGFQALYGVAGAILLPLSQALLIDLYPEEKKSIAIGLWAASGGISLSIGPIVGGVLLTFLSWRWIFLANVPFAILGFFLTLIFAYESKTEGESTKIDWPGVTFLTLFIGTFILATVQLNLWPPVVIVSLYLLCIIFLIALLKVEKTAKMPVIREELFRSRMFFFSCAGNFCMIAFFWTGIFLIPFYVQKQLGFTPLQAGLLMLSFSLPAGILSPICGLFYEKVGPKILIFIGFVLLAIAAAMKLGYGDHASIWYIALATFSLGLGFSFIWTPTTTGAISAISRNFAGIAAGTFITIQEIGGNMGLAITATLARLGPSFTTGFHNAMWVMLLVSVMGAISAVLMPKKPKKLTHL